MTKNTQSNENMRIYSQVMTTPKEAQKTITGGKLSGMTDINPMYRIKRLTEIFGPQGIGFKFEVVRMEVVEAAGEAMASVVLNLFIKEDGEWSGPIVGVGGSKLCGKGVGDGINDEAFKMAFTDAQSICCKGLGMCHDIYFAKDRTKYSPMTENPTTDKKESKEDALTIPFTVEEAMNDFDHCNDIEELKDLYNNKYGGNKGLNEWTGANADIAKQIKNIAGAKIRVLQNK